MLSKRLLAIGAGIAAVGLLTSACGSSSSSSGGSAAPTPSSYAGPVGAGEGTLNVLAWPGYAEDGSTDPSVDWVTGFEKETGCQVVVDVLHHVRVGADAADLRAVAESGTLGWVQVCDAAAAGSDDLVDEARHRRLVPGAGALPLTELLRCVGPDVTISVEVQSDELLTLGATERARLLHDATRSLLAAR